MADLGIEACPKGGFNRCRCARCATCGNWQHTNIHGAGFPEGIPPSWGHMFRSASGKSALALLTLSNPQVEMLFLAANPVVHRFGVRAVYKRTAKALVGKRYLRAWNDSTYSITEEGRRVLGEAAHE